MDITYRFIASGHGDVENAFRGIETRARASKKAVEEAGKATQRATAPSGTRQRVSAEDRAAIAKQRADDRARVGAERAAKREADAKVREHERAQKHVARVRDRHFADEQRKVERHEREIAKKKVAAEKKAADESKRSREKSFDTIKGIAGGAFLGTVAAGTALIGGAAREVLSLNDTVRGIAISGRKAGEDFMDVGKLQRDIQRTATATPGVTSEDLAAGLASFQALTGKTKEGIALQGTFATVASASGGSAVDVAEAAASLSQNFDISGIEDMQAAMASLVAQGKEGAVELKDVASLFQRLAAAGASFGLPKGVEGVKMLGGITQLARGGTGSPEQAATAVENIFSAFTEKQKDLRAAGISVFDKKTGKARALPDLLAESIAKVGGSDMAKKQEGLSKIFGSMGGRGVKPLITEYMKAFNAAEGSDKDKQMIAMDAVRKKILDSANAAGSWADVQQDAAMRQKSASAQLTGAWESIKAKTADALLPALAKLAEKLGGKESMLDPFIEAVGLAAEALVGLHDFLEAAGLIKKKEKSKAEIAEDAQKAVEKYKREGGEKLIAAGGDSKLLELQARATAAKDAVFQKGPSKALSLDDYVTQYMKAGGLAEDERDAVISQFKALKKNPADEFRSNDWFQRIFAGENTAQRDVRQQFQADVTAEKLIGKDEAEQSLSTLASNAKAASDALAKVQANNQGSIVAGQ